ncbi:hypothetical protein Leryth_013448 [Lithospermum erythrorhizon]|nr:hypothetical protein Leryth_013448 [Lithospermum erythrorhizon]
MQRENTESNVKVKDILRWRSSRDLVVEESTPLDHCYSPSRHTTITTASTGSTPCSSALTSSSSSWCESDFSAEDYYGENSTKKANMLLEKSPKTTMENVISIS